MLKKFLNVEVGDIFRTKDGAEFHKLPSLQPEGFGWLFANALNRKSKRFAWLNDNEVVKVIGHEPLDMGAGKITLETANGIETFQYAV